MSFLENADKEISDLVAGELDRQQNTLELIASENHASRAVLEAAGTVLTDKYAEGYPGRRWYGGCDFADGIEQICIDRAKALFGSEHANVQPHCGTSANFAVYQVCLKPGDKILAMDLACGGHLSHGEPVNFSGRMYTIRGYGVREDTETIDMDAVRDQALKERPQLIVAGASAYPRLLDFAAFGRIAREVGALFMADIAHIAGLIVGGAHPTPIGHADFTTTTTHKTLRGPRGAMILCNNQWARQVDSAVFPGIQGGPLVHIIAAKAVALKEAAQPAFRQYAAQIVANARALAEALSEKGWRIISGGTDNHLLLIDLRSRDAELTGRQAQVWLESAGIVCNKNKIPFDPRPPAQASGLRMGTPALTTRGMQPKHMRQLAGWTDEVLASHGAQAVVSKVREEVRQLCREFPIPAMREAGLGA